MGQLQNSSWSTHGFYSSKLFWLGRLFCSVALTLNNPLIISCQYQDRLSFFPQRNKQNAFVSTFMLVQNYSHNTKLYDLNSWVLMGGEPLYGLNV